MTGDRVLAYRRRCLALNPQKPLPSDPHELEAGVLG